MDILKNKFEENPYKLKRRARLLNPLPLNKEFRIEELEYLDKSLLSLPQDSTVDHESKMDKPEFSAPWSRFSQQGPVLLTPRKTDNTE